MNMDIAPTSVAPTRADRNTAYALIASLGLVMLAAIFESEELGTIAAMGVLVSAIFAITRLLNERKANA